MLYEFQRIHLSIRVNLYANLVSLYVTDLCIEYSFPGLVRSFDAYEVQRIHISIYVSL